MNQKSNFSELIKVLRKAIIDCEKSGENMDIKKHKKELTKLIKIKFDKTNNSNSLANELTDIVFDNSLSINQASDKLNEILMKQK